jgi:predicted SnoaL-like aldol condensation-catalyzing enzyme
LIIVEENDNEESQDVDTVIDMFRIADGKLAEHWDVADTLALFTQIGRVKT